MITIDQAVLLTALFLFGMALFGLAMFALALRFGPRRGTWNQPAARLRHPGSRVIFGLYAFALVQLLLGIGIWLRVPGGEFSVVVVTFITAGFYVLAGHGYTLATRVKGRRSSMRRDRSTKA